MPEVPQTMKALVTQEDKTAKVVEIPVPELDDDEVLVKVVALAQNPTDWKRTSLRI
jgi:NADPH:quinone reductase-like Zn-dependent oxidoreductase